MRWFAVSLVLLICLLGVSHGDEPASGWRGNWTGQWPDAKTPIEWSRIPHGAIEGMRCRASLPANAEAGDAAIVEKGLLREWLVIGPFLMEDSVKKIDDVLLNGDAAVEPKGYLCGIGQ